ncbi:hypothetical protein [uncultured Clostridium sp.]|uniref:hypothetical protein n=1 Tax=uncultured Clostridium sp. TaxID=59620 RepID=UPI002602D0F6|nr:hypothetical protein [uncultured Clostridium sp.]
MTKKVTEKKMEPKLGENIILAPIAYVATLCDKRCLCIQLPTTLEHVYELHNSVYHPIILTPKEYCALNVLCKYDETFTNHVGCEVRVYYLDRDDNFIYDDAIKALLKQFIEIRRKHFSI